LKTGDIVVASSTLDADGNELKIDLKMPANPSQGLHVGRLLTIPEVAKSPEDKQRLGRETGAIAVDMESAAVAAVCRERKVRFMAVRVISDAMNETLPDEALTILSDRGAVQIGAAVSALWKRPGSAAELWKLRTAANEAASRLGFFLEGVVGRLCEP
jgi:adenosylhomocysteine nucleosidase